MPRRWNPAFILYFYRPIAICHLSACLSVLLPFKTWSISWEFESFIHAIHVALPYCQPPPTWRLRRSVSKHYGVGACLEPIILICGGHTAATMDSWKIVLMASLILRVSLSHFAAINTLLQTLLVTFDVEERKHGIPNDYSNPRPASGSVEWTSWRPSRWSSVWFWKPTESQWLLHSDIELDLDFRDFGYFHACLHKAFHYSKCCVWGLYVRTTYSAWVTVNEA